MRVMMIIHVIVTCLPVGPVRAMLIVHVIVTCLPVGPVRSMLIAHVTIMSCTRDVNNSRDCHMLTCGSCT